MVGQIIDEGTIVFIGGIPKDCDISDANNFLQSICGTSPFNLITDNKNRPRGFAFVSFYNKDDAEKFLSKPHSYNGKELDCKSSLEQSAYVDASLSNIREPKKIYADEIPKQFTKIVISQAFAVYGDIEEIILIEKAKKPKNFAYITFSNTEAAQKCIKDGRIKLDGQFSIPVVYARPKFSKKMLQNVPNEIQKYIKQIQKRTKEYDPHDFVVLEDIVKTNSKKMDFYSKTQLNENYPEETSAYSRNDMPNNITSNPSTKDTLNGNILDSTKSSFDNFYNLENETINMPYQYFPKSDNKIPNYEVLQNYSRSLLMKQKNINTESNASCNMNNLAYVQQLMLSRNPSLNQYAMNKFDFHSLNKHTQSSLNCLDMSFAEQNLVFNQQSRCFLNEQYIKYQNEQNSASATHKEDQKMNDNILINKGFIKSFELKDSNRNTYVNQIV